MSKDQSLSTAILLSLYHYSAYANRLVLTELVKLDEEARERPSSLSRTSVRRLFSHSLETEAYFLSLCQEKEPEPLDPQTPEEFAELIDRIENEAVAFLSTLDEAGLTRQAPFPLDDRTLYFPIWQLLFQASLHATQHRGELSILLTEFGYPLPTMDPILLFAKESGQEWLARE